MMFEQATIQLAFLVVGTRENKPSKLNIHEIEMDINEMNEM